MSATGKGRPSAAKGKPMRALEPVTEIPAPSRISRLQFGLLSPAEIAALSEKQIYNRELYQIPGRNPMPFGVLDGSLGVSSKTAQCSTCGKKLADCCGHFGFVDLELPCYHIGYFKLTTEVLQKICKRCSRVMLDGEERSKYLRQLKSQRLDMLQRKTVNKQILEKCKKVRHCPHCGSFNGTIKKLGGLKLAHEVYTAKNEDETETFLQHFETVSSHPRGPKDLQQYLSRAQDDLTPLRALHLLRQVPDDDCHLLDMSPTEARPENLLVKRILVPPVCIRPSVNSDSAAGSNEDDLTIKMSDIIMVNSIIKCNMEKGAPLQTIMEDWDFLQLQVAMYINSELPGFPASMHGPGKPQRSFCQRLKGKQGRFRGNLSGKRVDFSSRTVISPDPNLQITEVAVPTHVARTLTYPERVNDINKAKLQQLVRNGPDKHPGANFVEYPSHGGKKYLRYGDRTEIARSLQLGDVVERHIDTGDIVLFNRQPSLHRVSIMCHRVRVFPGRTFRFNECVCTPYNADFDGDEMNMHVPQTEEARAEALELMSTQANLVTPRNGEPLIAATQDFLSGAYLLTAKDVFLTRSRVCQLCAFFMDAAEEVQLPMPAVMKPVEMWTGKQVFSILLRPRLDAPATLVSFEQKGKQYSGGDHLHFCPADGYISFSGSEHLSGQLDKSVLGSGNKNSLFYALLRDGSQQLAAICMSRVAKLTSRWLAEQGFSIGLNDVTPSESLVRQKARLVDDGYERCMAEIAKWKRGELVPQPGCDAEQTLEAVLNGRLSQIRDDAGNMSVGELPPLNTPLVMALSGSKGSTINISQMVACVGQQTVSGSRIPNGFVHRTLPHFPLEAKEPAAKGFVQNSFYSGMTVTEFFFHTMGGREGLVDTAVKTAETGYMQRRLMKALEDLSVQYDRTCRHSAGGIVQFTYGDDGLDPTYMESKDGQPIDLPRLFSNVQSDFPLLAATAEDGDADSSNLPLSPPQIRSVLSRRVTEWRALDAAYQSNDPQRRREYRTVPFSGLFCDRVESFVKALADRIETTHALLGDELRSTAHSVCHVTRKQLDAFIDRIVERHTLALAEPGTAVGALGGQSIGEPGTQMTLKTFHFAGVASMNITLGVPRIKEIINASKTISTPIITAELVTADNITTARIVKGRIERTSLGDIVRSIREVYRPNDCYLEINLDLDAISALQLDITAHSVCTSLLRHSKLKLKEKNLMTQGSGTILLFPVDTHPATMYFHLQQLRTMLPAVLVSGINSVSRAVINDKGNGSEYNLLVEGTDLLRVMTTTGVRGNETRSNHIIEVERVLGIEAARQVIMDEIQYTMRSHGMSIDSRHVMLLADIMTFKGEILGITRFGIGKMKDSVLMLSSFEKTTDHLFEAAAHAKRDDVVGVSECIILGIPIPLGTGLFKILQDCNHNERVRPKSELLLSATPADVTLTPLNYVAEANGTAT